VVYLSLDEWVHLAAEVLQIEFAIVRRVADLALADSALHAPQAGFADHDAYPDLIDKAAVLGWHLTNNHPPPDGNKRSAFVAMIVFLTRNGQPWTPPDTDDAVATMLAVADKTLDVASLADWLRTHTT
jgi:death-on-curing protein